MFQGKALSPWSSGGRGLEPWLLSRNQGSLSSPILQPVALELGRPCVGSFTDDRRESELLPGFRVGATKPTTIVTDVFLCSFASISTFRSSFTSESSNERPSANDGYPRISATGPPAAQASFFALKWLTFSGNDLYTLLVPARHPSTA